jgi:prepilin peptidase CpaA
MLLGLSFLVFFAFLISVAAVYDFRYYTIPNAVSLALFVGFLVVSFIVDYTLQDVLISFLYASLSMVIGFILFCFGFIGGGDVKFYSALMLWIGREEAFPFFILMAIAGGVMVLARLITWLFWHKIEMFPFSNHMKQLHDPLAYGICICVSAVAVFPVSPLFSKLLGL